jgi:hypothetical protein
LDELHFKQDYLREQTEAQAGFSAAANCGKELCSARRPYCACAISYNHDVTITLRGAFIGGTALLVSVGVYLFWLWRPEHQVRLHTEHFFHVIDGRNWEAVADFIGEDYRDQWDHDRARLLERMREGFRWVRGSTITAPDAAVQVETARAVWIGKINVYSSDDGVMQLLDERVNRLPTPFELEWHHVSGKPWDWKLVRVSNPAFQIPADVSY